jgi:hypothetical protein
MITQYTEHSSRFPSVHPGYAGSEMGMSEAETDSRHAVAGAFRISETVSGTAKTHCCEDHEYRGSEMGMSEAHVDALHAEAGVIRAQNIAKVRVNGICSDCPRAAERSASLRIFAKEGSNH